jgi:DNA-binding transcriptional ArsR family regulator
MSSIQPSDTLSATFAALADPTRRAILGRLERGDASVLELAAPFDMSLPAISKHLKVLERAGLISRSRDAQRRPCHIEPAPLREATAWMERYRRFWSESFDRLETYLGTMESAQRAPPVAPRKRQKKKEKRRGPK